jgi:transaldolase
MKIFLANSLFDDVRWASACGLLDGILVSPSILDSDVSGPRARALELCRLFACPVILSLGSHNAEELGQEARDLARSTDQIILEFPLALDMIEGIHRAVTDGMPVAASMVFTSAQALLAAKAGAAAVLVHVGALEAQGQNPALTFSEMRKIFDVQQLECEIVAVRPNSAGQVAACALAGVDAVVIEISVLRDLLLHPLADRTLDALLQSGAATPPSKAL